MVPWLCFHSLTSSIGQTRFDGSSDLALSRYFFISRCRGFIETEMTEVLDETVVEQWRNGIPLKRGGQPLDVANATIFLASDMSAYITGQTLQVCGGMLM